MEPWIARTIESVLSQEGDFEIEYLVINDASKDRTEEIAREYETRINAGTYPIKCTGITMRIMTQENTGMYGAINYGFAQAAGDIYAWINADDTYQEGAFAAMTKTFEAFPEIEWLKGITDTVDEQWQKQRSGACRTYRQDWIREGIYGQEAYFIEQDSCFWRSSLWKKGGPIPDEYHSAGDYWLWLSFARYAPLWSLDVPISNFMKREGQISKGITKYKTEQRRARTKRTMSAWTARLFFSPWSRLGPMFHPLFVRFYPIFFVCKPFEYIALENGVATKRHARSFII